VPAKTLPGRGPAPAKAILDWILPPAEAHPPLIPVSAKI
jgi:hypothetical protein